MASKNPIKGYVKCPTAGCGCAASVHAVGEHKAATRSESPKNPRRLGQLYLICPVCKTNQSSGKPFQDWVSANMKPTKEEALSGSEVVKTEPKPLDKPTQTAPVLESQPTNTPRESDETKPNQTDSTNLIGWIAALIVICFSLFMFTNNKEQTTHE